MSIPPFNQSHRDSLLSNNPPSLGHPCKDLFAIDQNYRNLNNGSFGAPPKHVLDAFKHYLDQSENRPDFFLRYDYQPLLNESREKLAAMINCSTNDLVLVPNATMGVNAILRGLNGHYQKGDAILIYGTVYGACGKTAQYIIDSNPSLELSIISVDVGYPLSDKDFLSKTELAIQQAENKGIKIRVAILDAISSAPGALVPWEQAVKLFKRHEILSLVDAAHAIGQIKLDMKAADPDFFITNCHKWLHCHRGLAVLYVPERNQHIAQSIPTSHNYESPGHLPSSDPRIIPTDAPTNFVARWEWTGTQDLSSMLSVGAAIDFRNWLGGEDAIMSYTTNLAHRAGEIVSKIIGSDTFFGGCAMTNIKIPLRNIQGKDLRQVAQRLCDGVCKTGETWTPFCLHNGSLWVRLSAQIWLEEEDFEWFGQHLKKVIQEEEAR